MSQMPGTPPYGPWPTIGNPGASGALLQMPDSPQGLRQYPAVEWHPTELDHATPWIPYARDNSIGLFTRQYTITFSNGAAGTEQIVPLNPGIPLCITDVSGSVRDTTGGALPLGMNPLDNFAIRIQATTGDQYVVGSGLGGSVVGTAQFPRKLPGMGWKIARGATIQAFITPFLANLRVDITFMCVEIRAGGNFGPDSL